MEEREYRTASQAVGADLSGSWKISTYLDGPVSRDIYQDEIDGATIGYGEKSRLLGCEGECERKYYADYGFSGGQLPAFPTSLRLKGKIKEPL